MDILAPDAMHQANELAARTYCPKRYTGRIVQFMSEEKIGMLTPDRRLHWKDITAAGSVIYRVPGTHMTMLRQPNVQVLAGYLKECLVASQAFDEQ